ncbi:phylloplanin-like [Sesamum indicum]|uniref:Phylloplanin-like n=1 Tax=Sesamum indicum TaxID=4182 RepID=A0A6I9TXS4_SESIN|nr:phylloplanin-like [Sesamum indicum]
MNTNSLSGGGICICMALKSLVLVSLLVAAVAAPMAQAQIAESTQGPTLGLVHVDVTLYCTPDGNIGPLGEATPPFPNAMVLLQCGDGTIVATATTNSFGIAYLHSDPMPLFPFFSQLESDCKLIVNTTLSTCDSSLPSTGCLQSALTFIETVALGTFSVTSFKPTGFTFNPIL